ncbi:MAG TPA: hypothetical protein VKK31_25605 [Thermoanaerobaculia bacterium]|nr:hypothetical protein [Thermoanaerobaculia bacterium]
MRKTLPLLALTAALAIPASAVDINTDLYNLGPATAYDVAIVLEGFEQIDSTYDGWWPYFANYHFRTFTKSYSGFNTVLHWENPYDETQTPPVPTAIPPGTTIHVGYSTVDNTSKIIDMYWTDKNGGRILGGGIAVVGGHIDQAGVTFSNTLSGQISISNIRYALVPTAVELADLTVRNAELMATLQPLPGPGGVTLDRGQSFRVNFPQPVPAGWAAIVVYDTNGGTATGGTANGGNGAARSVTFVQDTPK